MMCPACMRHCSRAHSVLKCHTVVPMRARTSPVKACDAMPRRRRVSATTPCAAFVTFTSVAVFVHIFVDLRALLCISALKAAAGEQISQITHRLFFRGERFLALSRSSGSGSVRSGSTA